MRTIHVIRMDAVFCHEITTPPAIVDLETRGKDRVFDPDRIKVVIDHVSPAKDSKTALQGKDPAASGSNATPSRISSTSGANGVCHALFPEKGFVRPGYTVIMGDSHTCTHGAFGAFAAGVGTTDLEVGILKGVCAFKTPETIRINITGTAARRGLCQGRNPVGDRPYRGGWRHQQSNRVCRSSGVGHGYGVAHDPLQHGH